MSCGRGCGKPWTSIIPGLDAESDGTNHRQGGPRRTSFCASSTKESESMSDYMFMLESHLSSDQSRVVAEFQTAANHANTNIFLTGGAMRDMLGGFPILEIDFTVEGNAIKL